MRDAGAAVVFRTPETPVSRGVAATFDNTVPERKCFAHGAVNTERHPGFGSGRLYLSTTSSQRYERHVGITAKQRQSFL